MSKNRLLEKIETKKVLSLFERVEIQGKGLRKWLSGHIEGVSGGKEKNCITYISLCKWLAE